MPGARTDEAAGPTGPPELQEDVAVPRLLWLVSWAVLAAGVVMILAGATRVGISFDEPYHVIRLQNWFDHGWYLLDDDLSLDGGVGGWAHDAFVYAPVTALLLHLANVVVGHETWGVVSATPEAYLVRHLGVGVVALVGMAATYAMARELFRSARWGLVAVAILVAMPMWTGHAMFNVKDVPTAVGYTLVSLAALWWTREPPAGWRARAAPVLVCWCGVWLGLGTRPGLWPGLVAALGLVALFLVGELRAGRSSRWRLVDLAAGLLAPLTALAGLYPQVFADPAWPWRAVASSVQYAESPGYWWYVPSQVVATMPTLLLVVALGGWAAALADRSWRVVTGRRGIVLLAVVGSQAMLLPAVAMAKESHLDTGLRQLLFAAPAVAVLLVLGLRAAVANARASGRRVTTGVVVALASLAAVAPTLTQIGLFPYGYAYASIIVDARRLDPLNDSWRLSTRELAPDIPSGEFLVCSAVVDGSGVARRYMGLAGRLPVERSQDCRVDAISPVAPYARTVPEEEDEVATTFLVVRTGLTPLGTNCRELGDVVRWRHFRQVEMSAVARCELVLHEYPGGTVRFDPSSASVAYLMGGWTGHVQRPGVEKRTGAAGLGFTLPADLRSGELVLRLGATAPRGARVRVNNHEVARLRPGAAEHEVTVPATVVAAMGQGRLVVSLVSGADEPVRLRSILLEAAPPGTPADAQAVRTG